MADGVQIWCEGRKVEEIYGMIEKILEFWAFPAEKIGQKNGFRGCFFVTGILQCG
ncbi:hypothetical protein H9X85_01390 [Anaerotignum lactatifermentans]|uniref:Uncharacterized protein n=1 Tax=Anaerotignum lactatifermentans TaxID=160404 RepID=A0ABS2G545_9FIRM|nr:hypothetical protein [Anaerotignum lactatifermentans]MBM6828281.1 hypothetical protein [Anaerotignum lactatifermentans]MBM6876556.1 hypothetical protein [Anaerotignum lactatifermentans]MBM6949864.1 hypothetical protein [Anaerotignum lactatifermentans]